MKAICVSIVLLMLLIDGTKAQPKLSIDGLTVDLGTMYSGQIKTGRITLRNIGNQPLKILHVQPSCGCTTVRQPKSELQPNESDEVEVSFNSMQYRGPIEKFVNIETNDPLSQYIAVKLTANIKEELAPTLKTYSIWLGNIALGKKVEQPITFTNVSNKTISIQKITSTSQQIVAESEQKRVGPSDTLTIMVTVLAQKLGYETAILSILTDSKNQPTVELKVYYIGQKEGQ
jgi:hypothetical protein